MDFHQIFAKRSCQSCCCCSLGSLACCLVGFPSLPVRLTEVNTNAIMENTATHASGGAAPALLSHFKRLRLPSGSVISNFFFPLCALMERRRRTQTSRCLWVQMRCRFELPFDPLCEENTAAHICVCVCVCVSEIYLEYGSCKSDTS